MINSANKSILDPIVNRYFFIEDPVEIEIQNAPEQNIKLNLHPDYSDRGTRSFKTKTKFFVTKKDFEQFKDGELVRLMDCLNFKVDGSKLIFDSLEYENFKNKGRQIIQWIPFDQKVEMSVRMPDNEIKKGYTELAIDKLKVDDSVQFQRFGFCRLDNQENNSFWFSNK